MMMMMRSWLALGHGAFENSFFVFASFYLSVVMVMLMLSELHYYYSQHRFLSMDLACKRKKQTASTTFQREEIPTREHRN